MTIVVDVNEARQGRVPIDVKDYTNKAREADTYYATLYMGAPPDTAGDSMSGADADKALPQAYFVEQPAQATVPAHFHDTNQFQVFTAGAAKFGKKQVRPLTVHYAGGHTPYGPIATDDEGVHFFTLRQKWDSGGKPMPQMRDKLKPVRRCHRLADDILAAAIEGQRNDVVPYEEDGLGVSVFAIAAGTSQTLDLPAAGGGQYILVSAGSVTYQDSELAIDSCLYRFPDEEPPSVTAGADGACVLVMQFPTLPD
jgi:hypothetical protein